MNRYNH